MKDRIGQLMIIGLQGTTLSPEESNFIVKNNIGGVILFERNCTSPEQLHKLCSSIHALSNKMAERTPMFIGIDMEGGRVSRLRVPFTRWPAVKKLGDIDLTSVSFKFSYDMGIELAAVGINLNFAPVIDTLTNPKNTVIGDRAISSDPELVAKHASALVRGYIKANIIPVCKHFPGHGNTSVDSHKDLPIEEMTLEELDRTSLGPFKKAFRARLDLLMTSHIKFPKIDPDWPVTLSPKFLKDLLRKDLRYRNMVISDDLDMKALTNHFKKEVIAVQALKAGCDLLLYCNDPSSPFIALDAIKKAIDKGELNSDSITESINKITRFKKENLVNAMAKIDELGRILGHPDHLRLAKAVESGDVPDDLRTT